MNARSTFTTPDAVEVITENRERIDRLERRRPREVADPTAGADYVSKWETWGPAGQAATWEFRLPSSALWALNFDGKIEPQFSGTGKTGTFYVVSAAAPGLNTWGRRDQPWTGVTKVGGSSFYRGTGPVDVQMSGGEGPGGGPDEDWVLSGRLIGFRLA